ncbi:tRNA lysidine(34) synthetase TilS [Dyadobacter frigoris]|uniref:tRNA(Ile)-lysidine synthase n=1 Tax=Dyadobacter frigoris TaxID=2576211 RepID=A0A4U6D5T1_9BACT|nr:tRNA lysidine(34) synthetase TilS [Dyadobacter frigoris]TKT92682.1 tRNA lysidine(34) synthetase TilS [Dyadobacter frigoris]GLU51571.1 tRNA(Ile)-lysidine synthase [Dyadobacter frigoris]
MLESFLTFINQQKLGLSEKSTLLTVSGGADSIVLAHLFYRAGFSASIAHCNFGLRDKESDGDELFVKQLAEQYGFPFFVTRFETKKIATQRGISTQMAARDLRYEWFEEVRISQNLDFIATAHHANDTFETVLLNLTRGTGLAGLHGISVINQSLIRPLLFASKEQILQYIVDNQLVFREDSSNSSNAYKRNLIRHEVVPVLKKMNPSLEKTFGVTSQRLKSADVLLNNFLKDWQVSVTENVQGDLHISIAAILNSPEPVYRLWFILEEFGFSYSQGQEIFRAAEGVSGKVFYSGLHQILKDRDFFIVSKRENSVGNDELIIDQPEGIFKTGMLIFEIRKFLKTNEFKIDKKADLAYLDAEKLVFPLTIRSWVKGDHFCPFGMKGKSKKISDLLIDLKLNLNQKQKVKIISNGNGDIMWVIGLRTCEKYKVTDMTREIIEVSVREEH